MDAVFNVGNTGRTASVGQRLLALGAAAAVKAAARR